MSLAEPDNCYDSAPLILDLYELARISFSTFVELCFPVLHPGETLKHADYIDLLTHLLSPEFFDAERTPEIGFSATDIRRTGGEVTVNGELTIKGITQPVTLTGTIADPIQDAYGNRRTGDNTTVVTAARNAGSGTALPRPV